MDYICKYLIDDIWRLGCLGCRGYDNGCDDYTTLNPDHQWYIDLRKKEIHDKRKKDFDDDY